MLRKIIKSTIIVIMIMLLTLTGNIMVALATSQSDLNDVESKINEGSTFIVKLPQNTTVIKD